MECGCNTKRKDRSEKEKQDIINHLNRISGQINGIKNMVETDRYCDDVLTQISAANSSLRNLGLKLLDEHLKTCIKSAIEEGNDDVLDEMMINLKRFLN